MKITLVGCGGTGSHIASGLAALALELIGRNLGCSITLIDPDVVEPKNVGRQLFALGDVGQPKAGVIGQRLQSAYSLPVLIGNRFVDDLDTFTAEGCTNIVIGAVDNPAARAIIAKAVTKANGNLWWLDSGNENHSGQIAFGNTSRPAEHVALGLVHSLPAPHLVYPDLIAQTRKGGSRARPGRNCAADLETGTQGLMVNRMMAAWALAMLHDFLLGELRYFALDVDLQWGGVRARVLDEKTLREFYPVKPAPAKKGNKRK